MVAGLPFDMSLGSISVLDVFLGCVGVYVLNRVYSDIFSASKKRLSLPPGPTRKPIIGNLLDLPPAGHHEWVHWAKHKDLHGPISSISIFGQHIVIINDVQYAIELLDKKASVTSDRPASVFGGTLCGWENSLAMTCYGERFKSLRKGLHQSIGTSSALYKYHELEEIEARRFLLQVLQEPNELAEHIRRTTGATILSISHGYTIDQGKADPLVNLADECLLEASIAFQPGNWIVDFLPFLRFLPEWMPGTGFKQVARKYFSHVRELLEKPHAFTKQQMALGIAKPSFTQDMLEKEKSTLEDESIIKWAAAAIYGAGSETTVSVTYNFFLAMVICPDVQRKAQAELDAVVGTDRLPTATDRERLPYIGAIVKEALRWNITLPMGIPHVLSEDTVFKGYELPKGAMVMANLSVFAHDPSIYSDPMAFRPERHLGADPELDPRRIAFGFGRRICPGMELAELSLYMLFAMSLSVFNISRSMDELTGQPIEPISEWTPGLISRPKEFKCAITPRSEKAKALIQSIEYDHPIGANDAETLMNLKWESEKTYL